jgi:hypothetical protein
MTFGFLSSSGPCDQAFSIGTSFRFEGPEKARNVPSAAEWSKLMLLRTLPLEGRDGLPIAPVKHTCPEEG